MTRSEMAERQYEEHYEELYPIAFEQHHTGQTTRWEAGQYAEKEASIGAFRIMCRQNLWFLATEVFAMDKAVKGGRKIWQEDIHGPILDAFEEEDDSLIWATRHLLKTTCSEIYCVQQVLDDPVNVAILLGSKSGGKARKSLSTIKGMLLNKKLVMAFPDRIIPNRKKWEKNDQDSMVMTRQIPDEDGFQREIPAEDPQIKVFGIESDVTGDHPTHIILDDLITEKNTTTVAQINKAIDIYSAIAGMKSIDTLTKVIGTPWHPMDLYHYIIENNLIDVSGRIRIHGVHMEGDREVIDYKWFTRKFLSRQKRTMRHLYWPQMHLDTRPRDDKMFVPPYPVYVDLPEQVEFYIGIDPSTGVGADSTGITVAAVDSVNTSKLYLVESDCFMLKHEELAERLVGLIIRYKPVRVGIEGVYFETLIPLVRMKAQERYQSVGEFPMPEFFKVSHGGGQNADKKWQKLDNSVGAMLRDGRILFAESGMGQLRTEMDLYDKHKQKNEDDTIDSVYITIATVPYFSYGHFVDEEGHQVATKQTWRSLVEGLNKKSGGDRSRMFAN